MKKRMVFNGRLIKRTRLSLSKLGSNTMIEQILYSWKIKCINLQTRDYLLHYNILLMPKNARTVTDVFFKVKVTQLRSTG